MSGSDEPEGRDKRKKGVRSSRGQGRPSSGTTRSDSPDEGGSWQSFVFAGVALLLVAGLLVAGHLLSDSSDETTPRAEQQPEQQPEGADEGASDRQQFGELLARRDAEDHAAMGEVDAPVVMVAYSDYHCPYCGRWARETQPDLMHYVEEGDLRIEWRDFPIITDSSEAVSQAARAAGMQGQFWEFHDAYFTADEQYEGEALDEALDDIADELDLDPEQFEEDRHGEEAAEFVNRDFTEGQGFGVTSTPAFMINGQPIMGAQPLSVFESAIDNALSDAQEANDG